MDLIALAVPFFLLALGIEFGLDRLRGAGYYRGNDAINSLSAGMLSTTTGYFTKLLPLAAWGLVLEHAALVDMPLAWFDLSPRGLALWITAALAWDFCYYWFHRLSHEVSILWAAHAVHHQSEEFNLSTALRQTSTGFVFGWLFYLPLFVIGFPLEVLLTVNAVNLIYQFWVHTRFIDRLGVLDRILVTPSNHRVHHAQNELYIDRNYGGMLIIWDRLFGTFAPESGAEPVVFGVRKPLASWNPFWANLQVYDYLWFDARRTRRWRDKLGIWFRRTGWRPADVERRYPKRVPPLAEFAKYDARPAPALARYLQAQFLVAIGAALAIAGIFAEYGAAAAFAPCLLLWAQLWTLGLINEARPLALRAEFLRLTVVTPAGLWFVEQGVPGPLDDAAWLALLAYVGLSLAGLYAAHAALAVKNNFILNKH